MNSMDHVLYINLKKRVDRKIYMENQFGRMDAVLERVEAIECSNGALGCALSHVKCLELAKQRRLPYVCICEDDIFFLNPEKTMESAKALMNVPWDVLLLGANIVPPYFRVNHLCMKVHNAQTTTGYIVKEAYYNTLLQNIKTGISALLLSQNPKRFAIDIYWKKLQQLDQWVILIPLAVVQRPDYSDIERRHVNYTKPMLSDKRHLLFC